MITAAQESRLSSLRAAYEQANITPLSTSSIRRIIEEAENNRDAEKKRKEAIKAETYAEARIHLDYLVSAIPEVLSKWMSEQVRDNGNMLYFYFVAGKLTILVNTMVDSQGKFSGIGLYYSSGSCLKIFDKECIDYQVIMETIAHEIAKFI